MVPCRYCFISVEYSLHIDVCSRVWLGLKSASPSLSAGYLNTKLCDTENQELTLEFPHLTLYSSFVVQGPGIDVGHFWSNDDHSGQVLLPVLSRGSQQFSDLDLNSQTPVLWDNNQTSTMQCLPRPHHRQSCWSCRFFFFTSRVKATFTLSFSHCWKAARLCFLLHCCSKSLSSLITAATYYQLD